MPRAILLRKCPRCGALLKGRSFRYSWRYTRRFGREYRIQCYVCGHVDSPLRFKRLAGVQ